jgi:hypothetical protein
MTMKPMNSETLDMAAKFVRSQGWTESDTKNQQKRASISGHDDFGDSPIHKRTETKGSYLLIVNRAPNEGLAHREGCSCS